MKFEEAPKIEPEKIPPKAEVPEVPKVLTPEEKEKRREEAPKIEPEKIPPKTEVPEVPKVLTPEEKEKRRAKRLGFEEAPEFKKLVGKGVLDTLGSVFGARLAWEAPKLILDYFKKKEQRGKISDATIELLADVQRRKLFEKELKEEEKGKIRGRVAARIQELNKKLKEIKMSASEKTGLRKEMAQILRDYRKEGKNLEEARTEKIGKLLDLYINNSAQTMVVAREAVNTVSIITMMPWLRAIGYTAFAGAERAVKAAKKYEKEHFREEGKLVEKLGSVAKNLTIDAAKETYNGLIGNFFKKEKSKVQKGAELVASCAKLLRVAGLVEFEQALQSGAIDIKEGAQKFFDAVDKRNFTEALKQGGENWVNNAQRLLSYIGLSENPNQAIQAIIEGKIAEEKMEIVPPIEETKKPEAIEGKIAEKEIAPIEETKKPEAIDWEKMRKLATIRKGEGITHVFVRQLENNPSQFGFKGNLDDSTEVHRWAQRKAYQLAVENKYINAATGEETRVYWNPKNPSSYLLKPDGSVEVLNKNEYHWNPSQETKISLKQAEETIKIVENETLGDYLKRTQGKQVLIEQVLKKEEVVEEVVKEPEKAGEVAKPLAEAAVFREPIKVNDILVVFKYNDKNDLIGFNFKGSSAEHFVAGRKLLKENWFEILREKIGSTTNLSLANKRVGMSATQIAIQKRILDKLIELGKGESQEAKFLAKNIADTISKLESRYGDIFK